MKKYFERSQRHREIFEFLKCGRKGEPVLRGNIARIPTPDQHHK